MRLEITWKLLSRIHFWTRVDILDTCLIWILVRKKNTYLVVLDTCSKKNTYLIVLDTYSKTNATTTRRQLAQAGGVQHDITYWSVRPGPRLM